VRVTRKERNANMDNYVRRLILDDTEHTDLGPATPEQIAAGESGADFIFVDDDGNVVLPGQFGANKTVRRCWID
jgi:hypothetical protein